MSSKAQWTWLVYMAGDNNLEGAGKGDLAEMKQVGSNADINLIVQFDTEENKTTRYRVEKRKLKVLQELPGVDCGDPKVLTDFLKWGMQNYPAQHYLVDIWNHGGGWENLPPDYDYDALRSLKPRAAMRRMRLKRALFRTTINKIHLRPVAERAIALDCGSHDYLDNQELRSAVAAALPDGRKVDILGCDACLMNMIEIAYEMKDTACLMVGSEETEPGAGWPYAAILKKLAANPAMAPADLAMVIAVEYGASYQRSGESVTQSALNLECIEGVAKMLDRLAQVLLADLNNIAGQVLLARNKSLKFEMPEYIDLGDFAKQLMNRLPQNATVKSAAGNLLAVLGSSFVLQNATAGPDMKSATGVSIYFPNQQYAPDYRDLALSQRGTWKKFLEALFAM